MTFKVVTGSIILIILLLVGGEKVEFLKLYILNISPRFSLRF